MTRFLAFIVALVPYLLQLQPGYSFLINPRETRKFHSIKTILADERVREYNSIAKINDNLLSRKKSTITSSSSLNSSISTSDVSNQATTSSTRTTIIPNNNSPKTGISTSTDPEYPYQFTGRLWFSPSIVKVPTTTKNNTNALSSKSVTPLSLFGYTLGGTVTLEYDTSPVGPYKEFVTMSSLVMKNGAIGQWGSRLYVSTQEAEDVCKDVWGVPAEVANIEFYEGNRSSSSNRDDDEDSIMNIDVEKKRLMVTKPPNPFAATNDIQSIYVEGWKNTRVLQSHEYSTDGTAKRWGNIRVLWTPTIKALWSPWLAGGVRMIGNGDDLDYDTELPLHKLRLSASAIRLCWSGLLQKLDQSVDGVTKEELGVPLGVGLVVDNVLIEIGKPWGKI